MLCSIFFKKVFNGRSDIDETADIFCTFIYLFILYIYVVCECVKVNMEKLVLFLHIWDPGIKLLSLGLVACAFND